VLRSCVLSPKRERGHWTKRKMECALSLRRKKKKWSVLSLRNII
jgi:hypothetical protein